MKDTISVLIPVYNRSSYVLDCLESVFMQTYSNFKIIIYDDGSTDETVSIINKLKKDLPMDKKNKLILVESKINRGVGYARNVLLSKIDTTYACWQDSDDLMINNRLERQLQCLNENKLDIVYCFIDKMNAAGESIGILEIDVNKYNIKPASLKYNVACPTGLFKSELKKYSIPTNLKLGCEDVIWLYKLIKDDMNIGCCHEPLYRYRHHPDRIGQQKRLDKNKNSKLKEIDIINELMS